MCVGPLAPKTPRAPAAPAISPEAPGAPDVSARVRPDRRRGIGIERTTILTGPRGITDGVSPEGPKTKTLLGQ